MRVLLVLKNIPSRNDNLKSDLVWSLVDALEKSDLDVVLLTAGKVGSTSQAMVRIRYGFFKRKWDGLLRRLARLRGLSAFSYLLLRREVRRRVSDYLKHNKIDVVLAECTSYEPAIIAHCLHKTLGIPFAIREHRNYESTSSSLGALPEDYVSALRATQLLMAVSSKQADTMKQAGIARPIRVMGNAVGEEHFRRPKSEGNEKIISLRQAFAGATLFGAWTRWRKLKRLDLLLSAFSIAYACNASIRLVVAGPIEAEYKNMFIRGPGFYDGVFYYGHASRDEILHLAHMVNCIVVPSDYETFALPVIEGMAAGKPAIVTRCNGPEDTVSSSRLGRVVDRGDVDQLAAAILEIAECQRDFDSNFIREYAYARYSPASIGEQFARELRAIARSAI